MSSFILNTKSANGREEPFYCKPSSISRFMDVPPNSEAPSWAVALVVFTDGIAVPVLEDAATIAHLEAMASERQWHSFRVEGHQIFMSRYDSETIGSEETLSEVRAELDHERARNSEMQSVIDDLRSTDT